MSMAAIKLSACKILPGKIMKRFQLAVFSTAFALAVSVALAATSTNVHPIVDAQSGYLLGGSKNRKWLSAQEIAKVLKGGEEYSVYKNDASAGKTTGSKTRTIDAPCEETQWVTLKKNFNGVLGVSGIGNPIPRRKVSQNVDQKIYRDEVAKILKAGKIKNPKVVISQLWRVDLDGDKVDEVLLSATRYANPRRENPQPFYISSNANAGDHSLVLLRKIIKGKVQTIIMASEIYAQSKEFSAPNVHRLAGVYDLNGDGKMEILMNSRYYEGDAMSVIEVDGATAREVLSAGCGA